jgi:hypothetical protein
MSRATDDRTPQAARRRKVRRIVLLAGALTGVVIAASVWNSVTAHGQIIVHKSPTCECCGRWVAQLRQEGFDVTVHETQDLGAVKQRLHVPAHLGSCHTSTVGSYVLEGHVPVVALTRLLGEGPAVAGIAVAGMPAGAPGMESLSPVPYDVLAFDRDGRAAVYLRMDRWGRQADITGRAP